MPQRKTVSVPYTWSDYIDTPSRRVVNLVDAGADGIPVLGVNRADTMSAGSIFHRHVCLEITVCERGSVKFDLDGRAWTLLPGMVFVTQPGEVHRLRSNARGSVLHWIFFEPPKKGESVLGLSPHESALLVKRLRGLNHRLYRVPAAAQQMLPQLMADYGDSVDALRKVRLRTDALRFLLALADASPASGADAATSRIRTIMARMRRKPEADYPLDALVSEARLSASTIATLFKRETGMTPHEFLVTCRIRKAADLLKSSDMPITRLALELGFSSSQHFAARFRRETGQTPRELRRAIAQRS